MIRLVHYADLKRYPHPWVAISNGVPSWIDVDEHRRDLAPEWDDVVQAKAGKMTTKRFTERYWAKLTALWAERREAFGELELRGGATCACYEKPGEFCHRRILAAFLVRHGFRVELDGVEIDKTFKIGGTTP